MFLLNVFLISSLGFLLLSDLFQGNAFYQVAFFLLVIVLSNLEILIKNQKIKNFLYLVLVGFSFEYPIMANIALLLSYAHIKSFKSQEHNKLGYGTAILILLACFALYSDFMMGNEYENMGCIALQKSAKEEISISRGYFVTFHMLLFGVFSGLYGYYEAAYNENRYHIYRTLDEAESFKISMQESLKELNYQNKVALHNEILSERNRIAKEIHDNVGHRISSAIFKIGAISTINEDENLSTLIEHLESDLNFAMNDIKRSVYDIYDDVGHLKAHLQKIVYDFHFCKVNLDMNVEDLNNTELKLVLISIVKEALSNVVKHSNASLVNIKIYLDESQIKLLIVDNGKNYVQREEGLLTNHLGLRGMRENIEHFGGRFRYVFKNGFRIYISIPIEEQRENKR